MLFNDPGHAEKLTLEYIGLLNVRFKEVSTRLANLVATSLLCDSSAVKHCNLDSCKSRTVNVPSLLTFDLFYQRKGQ